MGRLTRCRTNTFTRYIKRMDRLTRCTEMMDRFTRCINRMDKLLTYIVHCTLTKWPDQFQ